MTHLFENQNLTKFLLSLVIFFFTHPASWAQNSNLATEADSLMSQQKFDDAIQIYSQLITASGLKEKNDYQTVYKRAFAYYYNGQFDEALQDIDIFIPQFADMAQPFILRALIYGQKGEDEKQLESISRAIELQSDNYELVKWRGSILLQQGKYAEAKKDLLKVRNRVTDAELETNLALIYYSLNQVDSAFQYINKSIELDATYEPTYLYAGSFCLELEQYQRAITYLDLALLLNRENARAWLYKGVALIELNRTDEGCRLLTKAFSAGEDDAANYLKEFCYEVYK